MMELLADPERLLMFSSEVYRSVIAGYNQDMWIVVTIGVACALLALFQMMLGRSIGAVPTYAVMAMFWLWVGLVFHVVYHAPINSAAPGLAAAAVLQGLLLLLWAWRSGRNSRLTAKAPCGRAGMIWLLVALLYGPLVGLADSNWAAVGYFATTPHTLIWATLGMLLLSERVPWLYCLPALLLALVDATTAWLLGDQNVVVVWVLFGFTLLLAPMCRSRTKSSRAKSG
jgi:hypothetical protein